MLSQEELAIIKAVFTLHLSPSLIREMRMAVCRGKKKPIELEGSRGITSGAPTGKRKTNQVASSSESFEPLKTATSDYRCDGTSACDIIDSQRRKIWCLQISGPPKKG